MRPAPLAYIAAVCYCAWGMATGFALAGPEAQNWRVGEMVEAGPHPRLTIQPSELSTIRARLAREPYRTIFARIVATAGRTHDPFDDANGATQQRANTARAAAFLFYLDRTLDGGGAPVPFSDPAARTALGDKAALYLLEMNTQVHVALTHVETRSPQEVHLWAETLDLLLGASEDVLGTNRDRAIQNVADLAADLFGAYDVDLWLGERSTANNHLSKSAAAIGLAAMALNGETFEATVGDGRYDLERWVDFAARNVDLVLRDFVGDVDGGNAEGGSYMAYSAIDHVPFLWAWHRYTQGTHYPVSAGSSAPPHFSFANWEAYDVPDLWSAPWHERNTLWALRIMQPDGTFPPFDDCTPGSRYFFGVLARPDVTYAPVFRWAWERTNLSTAGSVDAAILALTTFDDSVPSSPPTSLGIAPDQVLPFSGLAVFRSDWEADAVYALLVAEHGVAGGQAMTRWGDRVDGIAGHDHADPGQVILHGYGEPLLIDAGYLGWEDHHRVMQVDDHNIVLIDGQGPQLPLLRVFDITSDDQGRIVPKDMADEGGWVVGGDGAAYLVSHDADNPEAPFAESETRYHVDAPPSTLRRRMTLLRGRFAVLHDRVLLDEGQPGSHTVTVQLHGNGGGTSGGTFTLSTDGALWERAGARLRATIASPGPVTLRTRESTHDAGGWDERTHTVLDADVPASDGTPVEVLTVLIPERNLGAAYDTVIPTVSPCPGACVTWQTATLGCRAWTATEHVVRDYAGTALLSAGGGAYCQDEAAVAGIFWGLNGDPAALLSARFDAAADGATTSWRATLHAAADDVAHLDLPAVAGRTVSGACGVVEQGERWRVPTPAGTVLETVDGPVPLNAHLRLVGHPAGTVQTVSLGETVVLSADQSCAASGAPVGFDFDLIRRPGPSRAALPSHSPEQPTVLFLPDLPGVYSVRLDVAVGDAVDSAVATFEVEGEGRLQTPAVSVLSARPAGCGCDAGGGSWLCALVLLLAGRRARRP